MKKDWESVRMMSGEIHTWPRGDIHEHLMLRVCPCKPKIIIFGGRVEDRRATWVHNSYDGREHNEPDHQKQYCDQCKNL